MPSLIVQWPIRSVHFELLRVTVNYFVSIVSHGYLPSHELHYNSQRNKKIVGQLGRVWFMKVLPQLALWKQQQQQQT